MKKIFAPVLLSLILAATAATAALRRDITNSRFFNPSFAGDIAPNFVPGPGSPFRGGGGVFIQGSAAFVLERDGLETSLAPNDVGILYEDGQVFLSASGNHYELEIHDGLACPLSRIVLRAGSLIYSLPPRGDEAVRISLEEGGLVGVDGDITWEAVAGEFAGTVFVDLVEGADLWSPTTTLSADERAVAISEISRQAGLTVQPDPSASWVSYLNTDAQVTYQVFLVDEGSRRVDIGGVPLRYYWRFDPNRANAPIITDIQIWSTDGLNGLEQPAGLLAPGSYEPFGPYDYILFYQVSGVFRTLAQSDPMMFERFSAAACADYDPAAFTVQPSDAIPPLDGSFPIVDLGSLDGQLSTELQVPGTAEWASFEVSETVTVEINVTAVAGGDPVTVLYAADGRQIAFDDDGGTDLNSRINTRLESGTYLIGVSDFWNEAFTAEVSIRLFEEK